MPDHFYVYPAYLDRAGSRRTGRRVSADSAASDVTVEEIVAAAAGLGYKATAEPEKQFPRQDHAFAGRVKVNKHKGETKTRFLQRLAAEIGRRRPAAAKKA